MLFRSLGGILLASLAHEMVKHWLDITKNLETSSFYALLIAALGIPITTITTGMRGVLEAYGDFKNTNLLRIFLGVTGFDGLL